MLTKKWENTTWVLTHVGFEFDLSDPQPDMICLEDIALRARTLRAKIDAAVVERFSLMNFGHHLVAAADLQALATERRDLLPASSAWDILEGVKPHAFPIIRQFEKEARYNFLNMYYDLGGNK